MIEIRVGTSCLLSAATDEDDKSCIVVTVTPDPPPPPRVGRWAPAPPPHDEAMHIFSSPKGILVCRPGAQRFAPECETAIAIDGKKMHDVRAAFFDNIEPILLRDTDEPRIIRLPGAVVERICVFDSPEADVRLFGVPVAAKLATFASRGDIYLENVTGLDTLVSFGSDGAETTVNETQCESIVYLDYGDDEWHYEGDGHFSRSGRTCGISDCIISGLLRVSLRASSQGYMYDNKCAVLDIAACGEHIAVETDCLGEVCTLFRCSGAESELIYTHDEARPVTEIAEDGGEIYCNGRDEYLNPF